MLTKACRPPEGTIRWTSGKLLKGVSVFHYLVLRDLKESLACNSDVWIPNDLKVTSNKNDVTCGNCKRTKAFRDA